MVQLEPVGKGIAVAQGWQAQSGQRTQIKPEAILCRTIMLDMRPGIGPGAIEESDQAMLKQAAEVDKGVITGLLPPLERIAGCGG